MSNLFEELKRRNVIRVGVLYAVAAWLLLQVTDVLVSILDLPLWAGKLIVLFLAVGFPIVLVFSWVYELTPEGLRREKDVDRSESVTRETAHKLNVATVVIVILGVAIVALDRMLPEQAYEPSSSVAEQALSAEEAPSSDDSPAPPAAEPVGPDDGRKSVAVLPFQNLSASEENAFFAAGVHEDILTYLSRVAGLRVNSRTSVQQYAGSQLNIRDIAAALGARYVVEGSVRRAGNQVRVTAQLIDAGTDEHLWAENFDRELTDIFAIQTTVARQIVAALEAELSPREAAMLAQRPTDSVEAYDLFLKARLALEDTAQASTFVDTAVQLLEKAVSLDPSYAQAWALLAVAHGDYSWFRADPSPTRLDRMKAALDRAFELQPDLPEARLALASYYYRGFYDYPKALEQLERVRSVLPTDPMVHFQLGLTLRRLGRYDEAIRSFLDATDIDPGHEGAWAEALQTASSADRPEQAEPIAAELEVRFPDHARMVAERAQARLKLHGDVDGAREILAGLPEVDHFYLWMARHITELWSRDFEATAAVALEDRYLETIVRGWGRLEAARVLRLGGAEARAAQLLGEAGPVLAEVVGEPNSDNFAWPHALHGMAMVMEGRRDAALQSCKRADEILPIERDKVHGPQIATLCAWVAGMAGETERALDMIEELLEVGFEMNYWFLALSPEWDFLRDNARFRQLLESAKSSLPGASVS
ncbi:MAG: tetratricopeptide repeat protein [Gammaproteobacteria bacterium]